MTDAPTPVRQRRTIWQLLLVAGCGVFIFTVLMMVIAALNPKAAAMAHFFDRHGMTVLAQRWASSWRWPSS